MFETNSIIYKKYYFNLKYFPNRKKKKSHCPNIEHKKQKKNRTSLKMEEPEVK